MDSDSHLGKKPNLGEETESQEGAFGGQNVRAGPWEAGFEDTVRCQLKTVSRSCVGRSYSFNVAFGSVPLVTS